MDNIIVKSFPRFVWGTPLVHSDFYYLVSTIYHNCHVSQAIRAGNLEDVKAELQQDPEAALNTRYGGCLPLHAACHVRHLDTLSYLLQAGAKVSRVRVMQGCKHER